VLVPCRTGRTTNVILYFATHTQKCTKSKLMHLLYLLDFEHFKATGRSVTDEVYCALATGPVPAELYWELHRPTGIASSLDDFVQMAEHEGTDDIFLPRAGVVDDDLTKRQLTLLEQLSEQFCADAGEKLTATVCAQGKPWDKVFRGGHGQCAYIPYDLALEGLPHRDQILQLAREHSHSRRAPVVL
jgi:uncharacterized phage-associated protein